MSRALIKAALRAIERPSRPFKPTAELSEYLSEEGIGFFQDDKVFLSGEAKGVLRQALLRDHRIPLDATSESWNGKTRVEAAKLSSDEKMTTRAVRQDRVAVKAFEGHPVRMEVDGSVREYTLPPGVSLDVSHQDALLFAHETIVVVENWEAFERIHQLSFPVPEHLKRALVVYRGQKNVYGIKPARQFLEAAGKHVAVFCDADPAGLALAMGMPGFKELMLPDLDVLEAALQQGRGSEELYRKQMHKYKEAIEASNCAQAVAYLRLFERYGQGLVQEVFFDVES